MGFFKNLINAFTGSAPSMVSGVVGHYAGLSKSEKQQNEFNAEQAEINRAFQQEMSNTAYQRSVADMQQAGLNPQLMYGGTTSPASTPSGSQAVSGGFSNRGLLAMQTQVALQKGIADVKLARAEAKLKEIEADYAPEKFDAEIQGLRASAQSDIARASLTQLQTTYQSVQNEFARDVLTTSLRLSESKIKLTDEQSEQVRLASGLIQLQQITESEKWSLLDAQTKELLTRAGLNEKNYEVASATIREISSRIDVNETVAGKNKQESSLAYARTLAQEIENASHINANNLSTAERTVFVGIKEACRTLGSIVGFHN